jgi:hypothetical protein
LALILLIINSDDQTKSSSTLNDWDVNKSIIDSFRSLNNEHTNVKIVFFDNRNFPFAERVAHAFQLADWNVNFNKTPQGNYNRHYHGGIEIKGDNRILVESIANTLESTGCRGVTMNIGATKFTPNHPKFSIAQNKVWITVGYET